MNKGAKVLAMTYESDFDRYVFFCDDNSKWGISSADMVEIMNYKGANDMFAWAYNKWVKGEKVALFTKEFDDRARRL